MVDILHRIGAPTAPEKFYDALTVLFKHEGWREPVEFMSHCSTKWATFLMSLKELAETGSGAPYPREVRVSNWT